MSWTILLLRDRINVDMPISSAIDYVKQKSGGGTRFKLIKADTTEARAFYSYSDTFYNRMGYLTTFQNELIIISDPVHESKTILEFKVPRQRIILYTLIGISFLAFISSTFPEVGLFGPTIILVTLHLGIVVNLNSQFHYLKSDIEQMEENYKRKTNELIVDA